MVDLDSGLKINIINTCLIQNLRLNQYYPSPYILRSFGREPINLIKIYYIIFEIIDAIGYIRVII